MTHVYLIPGFFGFADFGELRYFSHVYEYLSLALDDRGLVTRIHYVPTLPTSSLRTRAGHLLDAVARTASHDDAPIHLVGHSSGGLDARILASPGITLPSEHDPEPFARRIRSVIGISTPHHGTPLARYFASTLGQKILRLLSLVTIHTIRIGTVPLPALLALARAISAPRTLPLLQGGVIDQVYQSVLDDFDTDRRGELLRFFGDLSEDQALIPQIEPVGADLLRATTSMREGVHYGCVVSRAKPPRLVPNIRIGLQPVKQAMYTLFRAMHGITSAMPAHMLPVPDAQQREGLWRAYGDMPTRRSNDAVVPTLSQLWGELIHAQWSDHLDSIGHFDDLAHDPPHVEWLCTRSGFARPQFEALWGDIADYILRADSGAACRPLEITRDDEAGELSPDREGSRPA